MNVRESYSHALEQGTALSLPPDFQWGIPRLFPQVHSPGVGMQQTSPLPLTELFPENGAKLIETLPPLPSSSFPGPGGVLIDFCKQRERREMLILTLNNVC